MSMIPIDYRSRPLIDVRREELAGLVGQFLDSGGQIQVVPGFEYKPLPVKVAAPKPEKKPRTSPKRLKPEREAELVEAIRRHLAADDSKTTTQRALGISYELLMRLCEAYGMEFGDGRKRTDEWNTTIAKKAAEKRERHAPRVIALFEAGVSLTEIGRRIGADRKVVTRILEEKGLIGGLPNAG